MTRSYLKSGQFLKSIALGRVARPEPALQPFHPLVRGAVGEALRNYETLRGALERVVADRRCGRHAFLDVARLDRRPLARRPHARLRSEERRVGKECVSTCRSRGSTDN